MHPHKFSVVLDFFPLYWFVAELTNSRPLALRDTVSLLLIIPHSGWLKADICSFAHPPCWSNDVFHKVQVPHVVFNHSSHPHFCTQPLTIGGFPEVHPQNPPKNN